MSDAQQEHALAVERLAPRLAALRIELCPSHMSEGCFWKIYFVLLHPRLNKHDAELLSTPQIVEARAMLLKELQNRTKPESDVSGRDDTSYAKEATFSVPQEQYTTRHNNVNETPQFEPPTYEETQNAAPSTDIETEKHTITATEMNVIDKSVVEDSLIQTKDKNLPTTVDKEDEDGDDWLEETAEVDGSGNSVIPPLVNEEDVSFSDLEDDDDDDNDNRSAAVSSTIKNVTPTSVPQEEDSKGWGLSKVSGNSAKDGTGDNIKSHTSPDTDDSNDWLDVDDIDVA
ncbi:hypothetical protein QJS04_geneDACA025059 [Acorus gramineus]|uniref:BSD domain-containing protein n=1 Tax=Acorus gramineus TaxID=55184 RepID=A0AAV9AYC4_ACOGR|nr:hypothetical protein QJS04_geneDACA025059 [Acorus gramineus]